MGRLPLSGVARWSPLGSGGEDPAHPLALRLSEGAVVWAGPPLLPRSLGKSPYGSSGGDSNAISSKAPPPPLGEHLRHWHPGSDGPPARPLCEGGAIVCRGQVEGGISGRVGSWYPGSDSSPAHATPIGDARS